MRTFVRVATLLPLLFLALVQFAVADTSPDNLSVNLSMNCPQGACFVDPFAGGQPGNYADGSANFNPIGQPWNYTFPPSKPLFRLPGTMTHRPASTPRHSVLAAHS